MKPPSSNPQSAAPARQAVGYAQIIEYLGGRVSLADVGENIKINTRQLAKSQRTWFKRFRQVHWIDLQPDASAEEVAEALITERGPQWFKSPS